MAEEEQQQQQGGGLMSGIGDTVGKVGGGLGLGSGTSDADSEVPDDYKALAKQQQAKGAEGVEAIDENADEKEIAKKLIAIIEPALTKLEPYLKTIDEEIEKVHRKRERKEKIDEQALVDTLRPPIEHASQVLNETLGALNAADPGGKIREKAKYKTKVHEATPEENHLAELLSKLMGDTSKVIDKAKKLIQDMPHAKKNLGPLLAVLSDPIVQIVTAVGLLLKGVLGLVANLLGALHLDGLVRGVLGGLGLDKLLDLVGLGDVFTFGGSDSKK